MTPRLVPLALALVAGVAVLGGWRLGPWQGAAPGPGLFPLAAGLLLIAAVGVAAARPSPEPDPDPVERGRLLGYAGGILGFAALLPWAGIVPSTVCLFLFILRRIEQQTWPATFALTAGAVFGTLALFDMALGVPLPHGPWK